MMKGSGFVRLCRVTAALVVLGSLLAAPARAGEIWVAATSQQDVGGLTIGSNVAWPVTPVGAVRLAWGVPNDLQTFQSAKLVLLPHAPGGAATLNVFVCAAEDASLAGGACAGPFAHAFNGVTNRLQEIDISADIAPRVGLPGQTYLAILAYTTPTTSTDHILGLRFAYEDAPPPNVAMLGGNTFTGTQTAPAFVGDGSRLSGVDATQLEGLDSTAFAPAAHGHDVTHVAGAARLAGGNTFTGRQIIDAGNLDLDSTTSTAGMITKNGTRFLHDFGTFNTFIGSSAGNTTMTGIDITAGGASALQNNTTGGQNTAFGTRAMSSNSTGGGNTAVGTSALLANTGGGGNTAVGTFALSQNSSGSGNTTLGNSSMGFNTTGIWNAAVGLSSLLKNTSGTQNTALGANALVDNTAGHYNVAVGSEAGLNATTGSNNIYLGTRVHGVAGESNTMYLGLVGTQTRTFIAGVRGITTDVNDAVPVVIDSNGQLGTVSSSRRYKEDIRDMADQSRRLLQLRPVSFRYAQPFAGGAKPVQYGLIAEEVAAVFPELAILNADGAPETVRYQDLSVLLLNEVQRQQETIEQQNLVNRQQARDLSVTKERLEALERQIGDLLRRAGGEPKQLCGETIRASRCRPSPTDIRLDRPAQ